MYLLLVVYSICSESHFAVVDRRGRARCADDCVSRQMAEPKVFKGHLQKRGPTAVSGWNKRWIVIRNNRLEYYKDQTDPAMVAAIELSGITQINKHPDSYPREYKEGAFSMDVHEQKEIKTYFFAAASQAEKEHILGVIMEWRKWTATARKAAADVPGLQRQLQEAQQTIEAMSGQLAQLRDELARSKEPAAAAATGAIDADLQGTLDLLHETLEEERSRNARLEEALEEEKARHSETKRAFAELKKQAAARKDEDDDDPLDFFKKK